MVLSKDYDGIISYYIQKVIPTKLCKQTSHICIIPYWGKYDKGGRWLCLCGIRMEGTTGLEFWDGFCYKQRQFLDNTMYHFGNFFGAFVAGFKKGYRGKE